ncbi:MAG: helix-turn-helix transcriptional regulator [Pseudobutyrivibrio sp.]|nr:helix-turn-helix transcriptional regulator [Pseudobutyrivibrio sp.]
MKLGENIKRIRKEKGIAVEDLANALNISISTVYRYENSSIEKIPVLHFEKIAQILGVTTAELLGNTPSANEPVELPSDFTDAESAMAFILKMPTLAAFGGYDPDSMSDETIIEFANEILQQLKLVSYKYRKNHE